MNCRRYFRTIAVYVCFLCSLLFHGMLTWGGDTSFEAEIEKNNHYDNTNWMSGIADGRYLHEINIPGAHDACTQHVWASHIYTSWETRFAITQCHSITELLNCGVRMFDLRVTNCQRNINNASRDSLFMCHGQYHALNTDGLYYCVDADGHFIHLNDVLNDVKFWLDAHPSETVLLDFSCEFEDSDTKNKLPPVYDTLKAVIKKNTWIYKERNIPKLGDVRGRAVAISSHPGDLGCGLDVNSFNVQGSIVNGTKFYSENHFDLGPTNKLLAVIGFYNDANHKARLKTELSSSVADSPMYYVMTSSNRYIPIFGDSPKAIAEVVNSVVYGPGGVMTDRTGRKLGWVYSDFVTDVIKEKHHSCAASIWKSNYPDYQHYPDNKDFYYTLTYKNQSGQTLGVQYVLKGASVSLPSPVEEDYNGWKDQKDSSKTYSDTITVNGDLVLVPAIVNEEETSSDTGEGGNAAPSNTNTGDSKTAPKDNTASPKTTSDHTSADSTALNADTFIQVSKVRHTKDRIKLTWKPILGAEGYDIFASYAKDKNLVPVPVVTVTGNSAVIKKVYSGDKLKKVTDRCIAYVIRAYKTIDGNKNYIAETRKNFTVGLQNKHYSDAVKVTEENVVVSVQTGTSEKLEASVKMSGKGKQIYYVKPLRYVSSNSAVAVVNSNGRVQGVKSGFCYIYIIAANGLTQCVPVNVM